MEHELNWIRSEEMLRAGNCGGRRVGEGSRGKGGGGAERLTGSINPLHPISHLSFSSRKIRARAVKYFQFFFMSRGGAEGGRRKAEGGRQKAEGGAMPQFELNLHRCRLIDLMSICGVTEIGSTLIHLLRPNPGDDRRPLAAVDSAGVAGNAHQVN